MNKNNREFSPIAQKIFDEMFVPYIANEFKSVARISYLSDEEARKKWRFAYGFNPAIANHLLREAGMFYVLHFDRKDKFATDINILHDLATLMSEYMVPYFMKSGLFEDEQAAFDMLNQRLYVKNTFINRQIARVRQHNKRAKRKDKKNQLIQAKGIVEAIDTFIAALQETTKKKKRKRFIRNAIDIDQFVDKQNNNGHQKSAGEFSKLEQQIAEFKASKRKQNQK